MELVKGGNASISDAGVSGNSFNIGIGWRSEDNQIDIDASAFLIDELGKVVNDSGFIFYNQPQSQCGAVQLNSESNSKLDNCVFSVNTLKIPDGVQRIVFALSAEQNESPVNFNKLDQVIIRICDNDNECIRYQLSDICNESSVIMGELYRNKGVFKFRAVGQGYNDGLGVLARHFGVMIDSVNNAANTTTLKRKRRTRSVVLTEYAAVLHTKIIKFLPKINAAVESAVNESNTRMILDRFFIDVLDYDIDEVKAEQNVQGRRADYVLSANGNDVIVVEAKKAGMALRDKQIFQATSYGAYSGIRWALLTNLLEWQLYRVSTLEKVEADLIFAIKLSPAISQQDAEKLALISRVFMNHKNNELEKMWRECNALSNEIVGGILLTDDVISKVRNIIKRDSDCNVTNDQVRTVVERLLNLN
jgi:stress response protein SCP2